MTGSSDSVLDVAAGEAVEVLRHFPLMPFACLSMTALWCASLRDNHGVPAEQAVGGLYLHGRPLFRGFTSAEEATVVFSGGEHDANVHSWLEIGAHVGDLSLFRTVKSVPALKWAYRELGQSFGASTGMVLMRADELPDVGLDFRRQMIVTDEQLTGLVKGAISMLKKLAK